MKAAVKMQDFVIDISKYARSIDSNFVIIPQNGPELAFEKLNTGGKFRKAYIDAIDGIAVEDLFYNYAMLLPIIWIYERLKAKML
jgi:cysteinyl-tRNA synthetase